MERDLKVEGSMDKHGRHKKSVDWVALIDELWTSDDEEVSRCPGQSSIARVPAGTQAKSSSVVKASSARSSEACISPQDVKESKHLGKGSLEKEQYRRGKELTVVSEPTCPLEDPLTDKGDGSPPSTSESSIPSHRTRRTRQTDLLSFIDHKYSTVSRSPLTDIENSTQSDSTDDGYMTSDNSRVDYTPHLSLPDDAQHPRSLKSTRY